MTAHVPLVLFALGFHRGLLFGSLVDRLPVVFTLTGTGALACCAPACLVFFFLGTQIVGDGGLSPGEETAAVFSNSLVN